MPSSQISEEESKLVCVKYAWGCGHIESAMQLFFFLILTAVPKLLRCLSLICGNAWGPTPGSLLGGSKLSFSGCNGWYLDYERQ